jgi:hypothetical protein
MSDYRRPGVYVEEQVSTGGTVVSDSTSTALFVGATKTGPSDYPVRVGTWSDFVRIFGGFGEIIDPSKPSSPVTSYLPYAVYSFFQNGGRPCYVQRAIGSTTGANPLGKAANLTITDDTALSRTVTTGEIADQVATVTTSVAHGFNDGDSVTITGITGDYSNLNGSWSITDTPSDTTLTFSIEEDDIASGSVSGSTPRAAITGHTAFVITALNNGAVGNDLRIFLTNPVSAQADVLTLTVFKKVEGTASTYSEVERFEYLTMAGNISGTKRLSTAVNDGYSGSSYIRVSDYRSSVNPTLVDGSNLTGGTDPGLPLGTSFPSIAADAVRAITDPIMVNLVGYTTDTENPAKYVAPSVATPANWPERTNVFIINDNAPARSYGATSGDYLTSITSTLNQQSTADASYIASYSPWLIIPSPTSIGATMSVPPGGSMAGVMSRIDSTKGVYHSPAGLTASIVNAVGVDTKFTDTELGLLNDLNINVIRPVVGAGIAAMGARTGKPYGVERYISARRTLIYIKDLLQRSTQFALFQNNDARLWSQLILTADRILRPIWEDGGLRGNSAAQAYYVKCDETLNTPSVINSGEVRMEIGVALEYPAEFIIIRLSQYENGGFAAEVQPQG